MTMIAFTLNYSVPFVVGDILFTGKTTKEPIRLPTQAKDLNERLADSDSVPVALFQKIYIMKPNLCVALAGGGLAMQNFLEELRMRCRYYGDWEINKGILVAFLNDLNLRDTFKESAFCFMLLEGQKNSFQDIEIGHPPEAWKIMEDDLFEKIYVCGSGNELYLKRVQGVKHQSNYKKGNYFYAIQNNINLFARLLAEEKAISSTTRDRWGGGFETIYFDGNSFAKFDNVTYIIFQGNYIGDNGEIGEFVPVLIMHYKYYGETLLITSIDITGGQASIQNDTILFSSKTINIEYHEIGTIYKDYSEDKSIPMDKSFVNERIASGFIIRANEGVHTPAFYTEKDGAKVEFSEFNKSVLISIKPPMIGMIRQRAKEVFPNLVFI